MYRRHPGAGVCSVVRNALMSIWIVVATLTVLRAQPVLGPSIGLAGLPDRDDSICSIPVYTGAFEETGYRDGDSLPDFTLYTPSGQPVNLREQLLLGKPVVLIAGSYTCPVYRNRIPDIAGLQNRYGSMVSIFIVYTVEAHPKTDPSPYRGTEWTTAENVNAGILFRQPTTYGERLDMIAVMDSALTIPVPVLVDGPCNEWWTHFGPAPNNAYLIDTTGVVYAHHGWINRSPNDMSADIDSLLKGAPRGDGARGGGGFTLSVASTDTIAGRPGDILTAEASIVNNTAAPVEILVKRLSVSIPPGWQSAMCMDLCYPPDADSAILVVAPGGHQTFNLYFYTDSVPGAGSIRVGFRNNDSTANRFDVVFRGVTRQNISSAPRLSGGVRRGSFLAPNPAPRDGQSRLIFASGPWDGDDFQWTLSNALGVIVARGWGDVVPLTALPAGVYFWRAMTSKSEAIDDVLVISNRE